jgi:hypothetical protein
MPTRTRTLPPPYDLEAEAAAVARELQQAKFLLVARIRTALTRGQPSRRSWKSQQYP